MQLSASLICHAWFILLWRFMQWTKKKKTKFVLSSLAAVFPFSSLLIGIQCFTKKCSCKCYVTWRTSCFRLNISIDTSQTRTPPRSVSRGGKRKRVEVTESAEEMLTQQSSGYLQSGTAKSGIEISQVDPDGKFIKLSNTSSKVRESKLVSLYLTKLTPLFVHRSDSCPEIHWLIILWFRFI